MVDQQEPLPEITPSSALREEVGRDLAQLARLRKRRLALLTVFLGLLLAGVAATRKPTAPAMSWSLLAPAIIFGLSGVALLALAFGVRLPSRGRLGISCLVLVAGGLLLLLSTATPDASSSRAHFHEVGMHCALHGSKVSLCVVTATLILGFGVLRQFAPTGAMIGCGAGLIALAALHMSCSDTGVSHLMIWHGSVLIAFGVALGLGGTVLNRWLDD